MQSLNENNYFVPDLMTALRLAYSYSNVYFGYRVDIFLNPEVEHFILLKDIEEPIPQKDHIHANFTLNIL